jgi:hypothetical protein
MLFMFDWAGEHNETSNRDDGPFRFLSHHRGHISTDGRLGLFVSFVRGCPSEFAIRGRDSLPLRVPPILLGDDRRDRVCGSLFSAAVQGLSRGVVCSWSTDEQAHRVLPVLESARADVSHAP